MGTKRPTNENIHIGNIFKHSSYDECGSGCSFYQVVGLRGKTLVELRGIRGESYVDESCQLGYGQVKVRPLPGQFWSGFVAMTRTMAGTGYASGVRPVGCSEPTIPKCWKER